ncbi:unnamed protein product [Phytomonas sp. Hart1]|nr:unnamed protein product [Phytomonas sp. Hart1]|eukprot:CCW71973.1 unnamed protein product [Phytomonas sp. isolate Hart1]
MFDLLDWNRRGYLCGVDMRTYKYLLEEELGVLGESEELISSKMIANNTNKEDCRASPRASLMNSSAHEQHLYQKAFDNLSRGIKAINGIIPSKSKISDAGCGFNEGLDADDNNERALKKAALNQKGRRLLLIFLAAKVVLPLLISSQISSIDFPTFSIIVLSALKNNELLSTEKNLVERQAWFRIIHICFVLLS